MAGLQVMEAMNGISLESNHALNTDLEGHKGGNTVCT